jgi:hypothetical protein
MNGRDLICRIVTSGSDLHRSSPIGRSGSHLPYRASARQGVGEATPEPTARPAPPRPIGPHLMNCRLLRDLDIERNSFCSLTVAETDGGKLATQRRLGRSSTAVGASSGGAPALESAPTAVERLGQPHSGLGSAWQASSWHDANGSVW